MMPDRLSLIKPDILSLTREELRESLTALGAPPYRADQLFSWLHQKKTASFGEMTNLPRGFRKTLEESYRIGRLQTAKVQTSAMDGTQKYLFRLADGHLVETVCMRYTYGLSVCISSQVGCAMGCVFCASGIDGKVRNLTPGEMLAQIYEVGKQRNERISHVVVMGTGEPLDNYRNLVRFLHLLSAPEGFALSQRAVTVSTCGIVPNMRKLANENLKLTLALSLHAATQEKRERLMPVARRYPLTEVLSACRYYFQRTGRRVTYEYAMAAGRNTKEADAKALIALLSGENAHINLIPLNPVEERPFQRPAREEGLAFCRRLREGGLNVTIRRSLGQDIDGACGQLRRRKE